ncbi:MAG: hypothetical protein ACRCW6_01055 [Mycoplasmoidaceae bacterium]
MKINWNWISFLLFLLCWTISIGLIAIKIPENDIKIIAIAVQSMVLAVVSYLFFKKHKE